MTRVAPAHTDAPCSRVPARGSRFACPCRVAGFYVMLCYVINSACRPRATKHGPAGAPDAPEGPVPPARRWVPLHCSAGTNTPPADSNSRQKHRPDLRARHARAQTKYLTHGRPAAPLETSRSRLPARTAAHHQQTKHESSSGARTCRGRLVLPTLHEEARSVHRGHVEKKVSVVSKVTVLSVGCRHELPTIILKSCVKQNKAAGGQGSARKRSGAGRQGV